MARHGSRALALALALSLSFSVTHASQAVLHAAADTERARKSSLTSPNWDVYSKTDDLIQSIRLLVSACAHAHAERVTVRERGEVGEEPAENERMLVVTLTVGAKARAAGREAGHVLSRRIRILASFGEHGRELITSEVALRLVQRVCEPAEESRAESRALLRELERTELVIVPVVNIGGRRAVEHGDACGRLNKNDVDINRNFVHMWGKMDSNTHASEERPGNGPLSEYESRALDALARRVEPDLYLTVHSGEFGILFPWDHKRDAIQHDSLTRIQAVANKLRDAHCSECRSGTAMELLGYNAYGTGADHFYAEHSIPYALTLEIYGDKSASDEACFQMFNPLSRSAYSGTVDNWSLAFATLSSTLHTQAKGGHSTYNTPSPSERHAAYRLLRAYRARYEVVFIPDKYAFIVDAARAKGKANRHGTRAMAQALAVASFALAALTARLLFFKRRTGKTRSLSHERSAGPRSASTTKVGIDTLVTVKSV